MLRWSTPPHAQLPQRNSRTPGLPNSRKVQFSDFLERTGGRGGWGGKSSSETVPSVPRRSCCDSDRSRRVPLCSESPPRTAFSVAIIYNSLSQALVGLHVNHALQNADPIYLSQRTSCCCSCQLCDSHNPGYGKWDCEPCYSSTSL